MLEGLVLHLEIGVGQGSPSGPVARDKDLHCPGGVGAWTGAVGPCTKEGQGQLDPCHPEAEAPDIS